MIAVDETPMSHLPFNEIPNIEDIKIQNSNI